LESLKEKKSFNYAELIELYNDDYYDGVTSNWDQGYTWEAMKGIQHELYRVVRKYFPEKGLTLISGCALGATVKAFKEHGEQAIGIDITKVLGRRKLCDDLVRGDVRYLPFKDKSFDLCVNADLMEHIPEPYVMQVFREQARVAKNHFFIITVKEAEGSKELTHITIRDAYWWLERIKKVIGEPTVKIDGKGINWLIFLVRGKK